MKVQSGNFHSNFEKLCAYSSAKKISINSYTPHNWMKYFAIMMKLARKFIGANYLSK